MSRDSVLGTFLVAAVLCVCCSLLVSGFAEGLKEQQDRNKSLDRKKNVLLAAKLCESSAKPDEIDEIFAARIREVLVDMKTGHVAPEGEYPDNYDADKAAKDPSLQVSVEPADALMGVRYRAPAIPVYQIVEGEKLEGYIFPVEGKGLWSTLKGFLALEADGTTVRGITFYSHKETPGLGGEVDNQKWKDSWKGKQIFGESGEVELDVIKGVASTDYEIDGLSGATITSKGVDHLVDYWLGDNGFGPFLKAQKETSAASHRDLEETETQRKAGTLVTTNIHGFISED